MRKILIFLNVFAFAILFTSCDDFLDLSPIDTIGSNNFYRDADEVNAGIIAIYDGLQNIPEYEFALTEMRSDNSKTRTSEGEWAQFEDMNVDPTNATVSSYWSAAYNVIFRANTVLPYVSVVTDEHLRKQYEGEIYFIRALMYFNLVRLFGDVPLVDKVVAPEETEYFGRKPVSEVYNMILNDLLSAKDILPGKGDIGEGRATKGAAKTLLAKVYLTLGEYTKAKNILQSVIDDGEYNLESNYHDIFYAAENSENIFGIYYITGDAENGETFSYAFSPQGRAGGLNWPTDDILNKVDTVNDIRKNTLFYWNSSAGSSGDWACGKFLNADNMEYSGNTWIVLRYADVYLMYCEAVLAGGTSTTDGTALKYINSIRARAGLTDLSEITSENLLMERRAEFGFENQRLFDLIRFGVAEEVMEAYSKTPEAAFEFKPTALLLPIPQREINVYPEMTQNPGY